MNKKLIKTIASIICGLGTTTIIPCVASSCGNSSNNILPKEVYKFSDDGKTLLGFKDAFLNDPNSKIYKDKFTNCDTMRIPANATSIAYFAFIDDPAKKNSTIPNFITKLTFAKESVCSSIELGAFAFCSTLIFVNLPNSLIEIGNSAFQGCSILTSIDFSNATNLSSIGVSVFRDCSWLTSIDLSHTSLSTIGNNTFLSCRLLTYANFPSSLTKIGSTAFKNSNLSNITWNAWNGETILQSDSFSSVAVKGSIKVTNETDDAHDSAKLLQYLKDNGGLSEDWTAV